jgi:hypothetical protein
MIKKYFFSVICAASLLTLQAQTNIPTQRGDNKRTGANTHETVLTTSNVNVTGFGKLFSYPVDGQVYAQPLYISGVTIPGKGKRNVLFITTQHNSIYAYDADSLTVPFWKTGLGPSCPLPDANFDAYGPYHDIKVEIGAMSTPVIDIATNTLYAVAFSKENGIFYHKLYAIDINTGAYKLNSPVTLQASIAGTGAGSTNGVVPFESNRELQRTALVLSNGIIYIMFASYADIDPYHGWILGYNASNLAQKYVFNTTPNGTQGGIWMSGQGPSVDDNGDLYVNTANGDFTAYTGGSDYGNSFLKLHPGANSLTVTDYFTPYNQAFLNSVDGDLGSDAPIQIPNSTMIVGGSKQGIFYVVDRTNFGGYNTTGCNCDGQIIQRMQIFNGQLQTSPAYWDSDNGGYLYGITAGENLKAYKRNGNGFSTVPSSQSAFVAPQGETAAGAEIPGGIISVSSNGTTSGTGIVWTNVPLSADANLTNITGVLRAFDATDLTKELWNSDQNPGRDAVGTFAKFNSAVIVNGKVYQPTFSGNVSVYGLLSVASVPTVNGNEPAVYLNQNIPNPASQYTRIEFGVRKPGKAVITLFHTDGTLVKTLFAGNVTDKIILDVDTSVLPGGMYLYKMTTDQGILAKPMLVVK